MKYVLYSGFAVVCIIVLVLLGMLFRVVFFPVNTASKMIDTAYDAQDQVLNAQNAIYNYEWFKQTYQDIKANKIQLENASTSLASFEASAGARSTWNYEETTQDGNMRQVVLGLENYLETNIANYNARASEATRNIFQNSVLPNYIDALTFITK